MQEKFNVFLFLQSLLLTGKRFVSINSEKEISNALCKSISTILVIKKRLQSIISRDILKSGQKKKEKISTTANFFLNLFHKLVTGS